MSEEEKAIERLNEILKEWQEIVNIEDKTEREIEMSLYMEEMPFEEIKMVLNYIAKLQKENKNLKKENEEKDKQIDLMSGYMNYLGDEFVKYTGENELIYCYNERCIDYGDIDCEECIKRYFEKSAKENNNNE